MLDNTHHPTAKHATGALRRARAARPRARWAHAHRRHMLAMAVSAVLSATVATPSAAASFGITRFDVAFTNQDGTPATQAGSHPYQATVTATFTTTSNGNPTENVKDVDVELPPGLLGDPNATPKCTVELLDDDACPGSAQIGQAILTTVHTAYVTVPLYNLVPPGGEPAQFGGRVLVADAFINISLRTTGDYGLTASVSNISANAPITAIALTLWGVPADPSHDAERSCPGFVNPCSSGAPLRPFLTMPTACAGPLTTTLEADSWQSEGAFLTASSTSHDAGGNQVAITGCGRLTFGATFTAQPDTSVADSPSGLSIDIGIPQADDDPTSLATPALRQAVITLPPGISINPSAADGLQACSAAQAGLTSSQPATCPDAAKIGSAQILSPILSDPLQGSVYLAGAATPPASGLAFYLIVQADGVVAKLVGIVHADPLTGQLTATLDNVPQIPISDVQLDLFGGPRAALATPPACGSFPVLASLTPWSASTPVTLTDTFTITTGCPTGFAPTFTAGVSDPAAGASSPFTLSVQRSDTDQPLHQVTVTLPPGLAANLSDVAVCSSAQAAVASCPASSQVGTALVGAGAGPDPFYLSGRAYLTGPYEGASYGLAESVPALLGPLDLGDVIVRQAIRIAPATARVTVTSDPLPTILAGIPLRVRRIDVTLNRKGFIINPTSCRTASVKATLLSAGGVKAARSARFALGGCGALAFSPRLALALTGRNQTTGGHPALTATLTQPAGQANIASVRLALPPTLGPNVALIARACPAAAAATATCPSQSIIGTATVRTRLLSQPLRGPVYLVQGASRAGGGLPPPSLLIALRGMIALRLTATTALTATGLAVTVKAPDIPISRFTLTLAGGREGILTATGHLCARTQRASASETAHNGKTHRASATIATPCSNH